MSDAAPPLLHGPDGGLLPAAVVLARLSGLSGRLRLPFLPAGNRALPDLLALAGITDLELDDAPQGIWQGPGGGSVQLAGGWTVVRVGELPASAPQAASGEAADASAALDAEPPSDEQLAMTAAWLATARPGAVAAPGPATPAATALPTAIANTGWRRRRASARLAGDPAAAALLDAAGALHALQAVAHGQLVSLPLDGLAATTLVPCPGAVAGGLWEVDAQTLDNGRIRAELDEHGQLVRLCGDSVFSPWTTPALRVWTAGSYLGPARVTVLERGPVRARIALERPEISLWLELEAHASALVIAARARVPGLWLELPLAHAGMPLIHDGGPLRDWDEEDVSGVRGLAWCDRQGQGPVLGSRRGLTLRRSGHGPVLAVQPGLRVALAPQGRLDRGPTPWEVADSLVPHVAGPWPAAPAPLLPGLPPAVDAAWLPPGPGARASLLLREMLGGHARVTLGSPGDRDARWRLHTAAGELKRGRGALFTATIEPHALARVDLAG